MGEEIKDEIIAETTEEVIKELPKRKNPFCVISKATFGDYDVHDIQTNTAWGKNPYGENYAVVPDDMVQDIMATYGFCDIELNDDGTEIVSFTTLEIPEVSVEEDVSEEDITLELLADHEYRLCLLELG